MMRTGLRILTAVVSCTFALLAPAALAGERPAELPLRKVILYKHGMGYFERTGLIKANASITLRMKKDQMNDVLKSLTAFDRTMGSVASISYGSSKTLDRLLSEYSFDLRKEPGLPGVLSQLQGAPVQMKVGNQTITGSIVGIEPRKETRRDEIVSQTYKIAIMTDAGELRSYDISEVSSVVFVDDKLNGDLQDVLGLLFSAHRRDTKEVRIEPIGEGDHDMLVAYTVEAPVWKASYRLVLAQKDQPRLQGWAIVDNTTEDDWQDVDLSLVSGLPVSFVMNLYDPRYKLRITADIEEEYAAAPVVSERQLMLREGEGQLGAMANAKKADRGAVAAAAPMASDAARKRSEAGAPYEKAGAFAMDKLMAQQAAQTTVRDLGELFEYHIDHKVTIARDHSALLPIVNKPVEGKKVSLYNERTRPANPMSAVRIKNVTGLTLEGGPVTVYDQNTYAGEAIFTTLKNNEDRYVSYAVDLGTVATTKHNSSQQPVFRVQINRGMMVTHFKLQETKAYTFNNMDDREKTVVIEHPIRPAWQLTGDVKPVEKTESYYRFEVKLPKKGPVEFAVKEEMPQSTSYEIVNVTPDLIAYFVQQKFIDENLKKGFEAIIGIKNEISAIDAQIAQIDREKDALFKDQERLRANLKSLGESAEEKDLRNRYVKKLSEQEDGVQKLETNRDILAKQRIQKQQALNDAISKLTGDRQL